MKIEFEGDDLVEPQKITVILSRKNLQTLLNKLDRPESKHTICRLCENGCLLFVKAEADEEHYANREPGKMHPLDDPDQLRDAV